MHNTLTQVPWFMLTTWKSWIIMKCPWAFQYNFRIASASKHDNLEQILKYIEVDACVRTVRQPIQLPAHTWEHQDNLESLWIWRANYWCDQVTMLNHHAHMDVQMHTCVEAYTLSRGVHVGLDARCAHTQTHRCHELDILKDTLTSQCLGIIRWCWGSTHRSLVIWFHVLSYLETITQFNLDTHAPNKFYVLRRSNQVCVNAYEFRKQTNSNTHERVQSLDPNALLNTIELYILSMLLARSWLDISSNTFIIPHPTVKYQPVSESQIVSNICWRCVVCRVCSAYGILHHQLMTPVLIWFTIVMPTCCFCRWSRCLVEVG